MNRVAVVGAGAWGTALAIQALRAGGEVSLWARDPAGIGAVSPRLPGVALPPGIRVTGDLPGRADAILVAVPMQHLRQMLGRMRPEAPLLLCCKGLEAVSLGLPLEVAGEVFPEVPAAVLTGPNFAMEIAEGLPAASVVAGVGEALRQVFIAALGSPTFRLYGNDDPVGAQIGGAAKNVIAIAAGVVMGAGLGENARAALITRGLAEISRLALALGGRAETVAGLSGLGDLVLTCTGPGSRNFGLGFALGGGGVLPVSGSGPVVEGIATAPALLARAPGVDLPIICAVAELLAGRVNVRQAVASMLLRPLKNE